MANPHRGEVALSLFGRHYTLRPSFQALCSIEALAGRCVAQLLGDICNWGLSLADISLILTAATGNDWDKDPAALPPESLRQAADAIARFLKNGLCAGDMACLHATDNAAVLSWEDLAALGIGTLGLSPDAFWQMTRAEFIQYYSPYLRLQAGGASLTREELAALMAHFPDTSHEVLL